MTLPPLLTAYLDTSGAVKATAPSRYTNSHHAEEGPWWRRWWVILADWHATDNWQHALFKLFLNGFLGLFDAAALWHNAKSAYVRLFDVLLKYIYSYIAGILWSLWCSRVDPTGLKNDEKTILLNGETLWCILCHICSIVPANFQPFTYFPPPKALLLRPFTPVAHQLSWTVGTGRAQDWNSHNSNVCTNRDATIHYPPSWKTCLLCQTLRKFLAHFHDKRQHWKKQILILITIYLSRFFKC